MNKIIGFIVFLILISSCENEDSKKQIVKPEKLIEVKNGVYTEWYAGKKQIKFLGALDEKGNRDGKWVFYSENGTESSICGYEKGLKNGFSIVKYPNGALHYRGEYRDNKMIGIWSSYDEKGAILSNKDYGMNE